MEELKKILKSSLTQIIFPIIVGASTFLLTKSKYDTEVVENELSNVKTAIEIYKAMAIDIREENVLLKNRVMDLENSVIELKQNCP